MPLLNFKKQFAPLVELGLIDPEHPCGKRQTIRARRKDGKDPAPGQTLYLYTGLRTKAARRLGTAPCARVTPIEILQHTFILDDTWWLSPREAGSIAHDDGFKCLEDFFNFFKKNHGLPFSGLLIEW